jgi:hypothetical protein
MCALYYKSHQKTDFFPVIFKENLRNEAGQFFLKSHLLSHVKRTATISKGVCHVH